MRAGIPALESSFESTTGTMESRMTDDPSLGYPLQSTATEGSETSPLPPNGPVMILTLEGHAHRSIYGEGKGGRAADLDGDADSPPAPSL